MGPRQIQQYHKPVILLSNDSMFMVVIVIYWTQQHANMI